MSRYYLDTNNELSHFKAKELACAIAVALQKVGFQISDDIYLQLPTKYQKYFKVK